VVPVLGEQDRRTGRRVEEEVRIGREVRDEQSSDPHECAYYQVRPYDTRVVPPYDIRVVA